MCKKVFIQKIDFTRHQEKKTPCISLNEIKEIVKTKEIKTDTKNTLINIFKSCLDTMRDNEGLTGEKALRNLSYLLTLKLLEPRFNNEINIDDYEYKFDEYEDCIDIKEHKNKLLKLVRFSVLSKENEMDIPVIIKSLWDDILSKHPTTQNIFLKDKGFDIQRQSTFKKLIDKLNTLDLSKTDHDILGNAYEEVIKDIMTGKVLGQFFTQPMVKKMMVKLINPQIFPDGKIETCCDPTMGTAGFLTEYLKHVLHQANSKNIKPDWNFIKLHGLYGKELEPDTYQLAVSNMLISSGHMFEKLDRGDSIRQPITEQYDTVLANPPFGIKGLKYDDFESDKKIEYLPIKSDNAVSLFIQAIIYMLKINGRCAVVLPDGQDLFSKTNKTLIAVREFLMKSCDLKEIIYLPSGIFTYTTIKTCVFYFIKKKNGKEILEIKKKEAKAGKTYPREYKFTKTHQTSNIKFYDYNPYEDIKNLLVEVLIDKIANNSYSLNYAEYMKDETDEEHYEEGVIVKTLGEICNIDYGTRIVKENNIEGDYPVFGSGRATFTTNTFNREGFNILIGRFALSQECVRLTNEKLFLNDSGLSIKPITNIILHKYIGYFILHNQDAIYNYARGSAQKNLDIDKFKSIKIPIPSIKYQKIAIEYLDALYASNKTSNEKIDELNLLMKHCFTNQKIFGKNETKILDDICTIDIGGTPSREKNEYYKNGNNLWVSVRELNGGYINNTKEKITDLGVKNSSVKLFQKDTILFSFKLSIGKIAIVDTPLYTNEAIAGLYTKNNNILQNKFLYYYLKNNDFSNMGSGLIGNGSLNKKTIRALTILVPSIERQKQIIEFCEHKDNLIKQLEKEIENNKQIAQEFIINITKAKIKPITDDDCDISLSIDDEKSENISSNKIEKKKIKYIIKTDSTSDESNNKNMKKEIIKDNISSDKIEKQTKQ